MNFNNYSDDMLKEYIIDAKKRLGDRLLIPGHHYISKDIIDIADITGDSYKLAVDVSRSNAEFIVFCGVRFMADGAKILASENQHILHPEPDAGCPMADMIDEETAEKAVAKISNECSREIIPLVYMNSDADSKSFCGRKGGAVCTSSNAEKLVQHFLDKGKSIFFFPDYHLGANTAKKLNIDESLIVKVERDISFEDKDIKNGRMFLWDGFCPIHQEFDDEDIISMRKKYPTSKIIVHPETKSSVFSLSDISGSTQKIFDNIAKAKDGSIWIVGTETTFVNRIAATFPNQTILALKQSPCKDMVKINLKNTAEIIKSVEDFIDGKGVLKNEVFVENRLRENAKIALNRMIDIVEDKVN
ncbi:MAG: quinolinate synthase NadA [Leptospirales bacterium]|nr:quinolinate synthase NadA [Leptospirales bacterium]